MSIDEKAMQKAWSEFLINGKPWSIAAVRPLFEAYESAKAEAEGAVQGVDDVVHPDIVEMRATLEDAGKAFKFQCEHDARLGTPDYAMQKASYTAFRIADRAINWLEVHVKARKPDAPDVESPARVDDLMGEAYQIAGQIIAKIPGREATEAQGTRLLDILAYELPDALSKTEDGEG